MAQKDYVKRGRAKPAPAPEPKKALPWVRLLVTVALVAGFGYFLFSISQTDTEVEQSNNSIQQSEIQTEPSAQAEALPEMPEDTYLYPEALKQKTVEIDRQEQQKSEKPYLMQCGSFRQQDQADSMRAKLALQGLEAQVRPSDGKNGRWYRVILGPYDYKRDAEVDRHVIQRVGISTCQIWFWNLN